MPALNGTLYSPQLFHQSHATFPGFTHEASAKRDGEARRNTMSLSRMSLSSADTLIMRQGNFCFGFAKAI